MKNSILVTFGSVLLLQACHGPEVVPDKKAADLAHAKEAERDRDATEAQLKKMRQQAAQSQQTNEVNEASPKH